MINRRNLIVQTSFIIATFILLLYPLVPDVRAITNDENPPKIVIEYPTNDAKISSKTINLKALIEDDTAIASFYIKVNDKIVMSEKPDKPKFIINTTLQLEPGENTIFIEASDPSENKAEKSVRIYRVNLIIIKTQIDDSVFGNGDGELKAGETVEFKAVIQNVGVSVAKDVNARFIYEGPDLQIRTPSAHLRNVFPGTSSTASFIFSISENYSSKSLKFQIELSDEQGYKSTETMEFNVKEIKKPEIVIYEPSDNAEIASESLSLKAEIKDNVMLSGFDVKVNDKIVKSDKLGVSKFVINIMIPLNQGENKIQIQVSDWAGNKSEKWINVFMFPPEAKLAISKILLDDTLLENGNGEIESGANVNLKMIVENTGSGIAKNIKAKLTCTDTNILIKMPLIKLNDINPGSSTEALFALSAPLTYTNEKVSFSAEIGDEQNVRLTKAIEIKVKDTKQPEIVIYEPTDKFQTENTNVRLRADIIDNIMITSFNIKVNGKSVKSNEVEKAKSVLDEILPIEPGENRVSVEILDSSNNKTEEMISVYMIPPKPNIFISTTEIEDTSLGNGNGQIETGETITLKVKIENKGSGVAKDISAKLSSPGTGVQIETPLLRMRNIQSGVSNIGLFIFSISPDYDSEKVILQIELSDDQNHKSIKELEFKVNDVTKPEIIVNEPVENTKTDAEVINLIADVVDNLAIASIDVKVNNKLIKSEKPLTAKATINTVIPLESGDNSICVDTSDSAGNKFEKIVTIQRTLPILKVSYVNPPDKVGLGETLDVVIFIKNEGTGTAKDVVVSIESADMNLSQMNPLGNLEAKEQKTVPMSVFIPADIKLSFVKFTVTAVDARGCKSNEPQFIAQLIQVDTKPPEITLLNPPIQRGMKIVHEEKKMNVRLRVKDESGISKVTVNNIEAKLVKGDEYEADINFGNTNADVVLTVVAVDNNKNEAKLEFYVRYEPRLEFTMGKYYALIIGIQDYMDSSVNDLDFPVKDAESFKQVLINDYIFDENNVYILKNPKRSEIINELEQLRKKLTAQDNLIIFYAGHGYWDEDMKQGYWLPSNASADNPSEWLSNSTIRDYISAIKTKHILLIADACFSGGIFKTREAFVKPEISIQKIYESKSRKAITSGNLKTVPDKSVFVGYLIKMLKDNKDKYMIAEKMFVNMREPVINNSPLHQTPLYGVIQESGDEGGDFIFVHK